MKKIYGLLAGVMLSLPFLAQAPQKMNYQAVIRNASNALLTNQIVQMRISVLQGSDVGTPQYAELHTTSTNANGLVTIAIGAGSPVLNSFSDIDWANGPFFIKTETDPTGGTNFTIIGTSQLMSVPYALFSANGGGGGQVGPQGPQGPNGPQGPAGPVGTQGIQGPSGPAGATGSAGPQGNTGLNGDKYTTTSLTNLSISVGSKTLNLEPGLSYAVGQTVIIANSVSNFMTGTVVSYNSTTGAMTANVTLTAGSGSFNSWSVSLNGAPGPSGATGNTGATGVAGPQGTQGPQGPAGATGSQGPAGAIGPAGSIGATGPTGATGAPGVTGAVGPAGAANINGTTNRIIKFTSATAGGNSQLFDNGTNVGLGTTSPEEKLDVRSSNTGHVAKFANTNIAGTSSLAFSDNTNTNQMFVGYANTGYSNPLLNGKGYVLANRLVFSTQNVNRLEITETGNIGIGNTTPTYLLDIVDPAGFRAVSAINTTPGSTDRIGLFGSHNVTPYYGIGVYGEGGYRGVQGLGLLIGSTVNTGIYGNAGNGITNYGVYGTAFSGTSYGVYSAGNFTCTGTKAATVKTPSGPKELYSQESPELWFEDFGKAIIQNGTCTVTLAADYAETVTVNAEHPMHAFITPNGNMGNWWIEYSGTSFIVKAPQAANGTAFDYRLVAKRIGYENLRMKKVPSSYTDSFLYPTVDLVPVEYKEDWLKMNTTRAKK